MVDSITTGYDASMEAATSLPVLDPQRLSHRLKQGMWHARAMSELFLPFLESIFESMDYFMSMLWNLAFAGSVLW